MRNWFRSLALLGVFLSACNLAGDITPPPAVATGAALRPTIGAVVSPQPTSAPINLTPPETRANLQNGELIYLEKCAPCHGAEGGGDGPQAANLPEGIVPSSLGDRGVAFSSTPAEWFSIVSVGNMDRFMPGFSSLNEAERWDVVAYAFTLSSTEEDLTGGAQIYQQNCTQCHGANGEGTEVGSPLADPTLFVNRTVDEIMTVIRDGTDRQMPSFEDELTAGEIASVSAYLMSLGLAGGGSAVTEESVADPDRLVSGVVQGQAINGTTGAEIPPGLSVTLFGFEGQREVLQESVDVDEAGAFIFSELELQLGWLFVATLEHQGVVYGSEIVEYAGEEELFLPLTFFETTDDLGAVYVDRLHVILNRISEGVLEVSQVWIISNSSERTLSTADGTGILEISLPQGATSLQFESGEIGDRFISTGSGFVDTLPLRPGLGTHELVFSFLIAYEDGMDYQQLIAYPVDAAVILTSASALEVEGEGIIDQGTREMGESLIHTYDGGRIQAGGEIALTIVSVEVEEAGADVSSFLNLGIGIISILAAVAAVGIWWFRREMPPPQDSAQPDSIDSTTDISIGQDREELLLSIANLDDAFEAGDIEEGAYQSRRSELKSKLLELMHAADHD